MLRFVNTHFDYGNTLYTKDPAGTAKAIAAAGFTGIRDNSAATGVAIAKAAGLKVISVCATGAIAAKAIAAGADYIEGPNERNAAALGANRLVDLATNWHDIVTARNAAKRWVPLIAPAFSMANAASAVADAKTVGALRDADYGNVHSYPAGVDVPTYQAKLVTALQVPAIMAPGKPVWLTEYGTWWGGPTMTDPHTPTDPAKAAQLYPGWDQAIADLGFYGAAIYAWADQPGSPGREAFFGLVDKDGKDKLHTAVVRSCVRPYAAVGALAALTSRMAQTNAENSRMLAALASARTDLTAVLAKLQ